MTPDALIARFEQDVAHAERTLRTQGTVRPLFAVVDDRGRTRPVVADFTSEEAKDVSFAIVRLICAADAAEAVFHQTEAWLVLGDMAPGLSASQSERRIEALLVSCVARVDGALQQKVRVREIKRDLVGATIAAGLQNRQDCLSFGEREPLRFRQEGVPLNDGHNGHSRRVLAIAVGFCRQCKRARPVEESRLERRLYAHAPGGRADKPYAEPT